MKTGLNGLVPVLSSNNMPMFSQTKRLKPAVQCQFLSVFPANETPAQASLAGAEAQVIVRVAGQGRRCLNGCLRPFSIGLATTGPLD
ncbi:hypothetical protein E2K80_16200 [Rhodophyticola sp. CCM32]|uniref:hypothetical protein n=1 Tax=Rhodophyticola sp. CCM32 TaxID=2916397 RepID=UPI00107FB0A3|nr:hypothetical protein [Rhodophyticola sp. CCM32]QBY02085.1 hypothetical protein E2K80_16200 [Rhodophyticola sp. CCM32]